jgi:hypothetical protein
MTKYGGIALTLLIGFAFVGANAPLTDADFLPNQLSEITSDSSNENIALNANVHVYKNGEPVAEQHNVLMEGEAAIVDLLQTSNSDEYETIAVGNGTTPVDSDGSLDGRITSCGFSPTTGSVDVAGDGESYNVTNTFTSTCSIDVSTTALEVNSGYGDSTDTFAGTEFGRTIPFEPDDQLTVEWKISPQNP